jgi:hypothetical protein
MVRIAVAVLSLSFFLGQAHASTGMTRDEQWACEVAMCVSNPDGPTAVAECAAPIRKLHEQLARGKPVPRCRFLAAADGDGAPRDERDERDDGHVKQQSR